MTNYSQSTFLQAYQGGKRDFRNEGFYQWTDLSSLRKKDVSFANFQLQRCSFWCTKLAGLNFDGSDCEQANFMRADTHWTSFKSANLSHCDFTMTNCIETDFTDANLFCAKFESSSTCCKMADFTNSNLESCNFREVDCTDADFTGAIFKGTRITWTKLQGAKISRDQLEASGSLGYIKSDFWDKCTLAPQTARNMHKWIDDGGFYTKPFDESNGFQKVDNGRVPPRGKEDAHINWPWWKSPFRIFFLSMGDWFPHPTLHRSNPFADIIVTWLNEWVQEQEG